jgi:hypothetical protein
MPFFLFISWFYIHTVSFFFVAIRTTMTDGDTYTEITFLPPCGYPFQNYRISAYACKGNMLNNTNDMGKWKILDHVKSDPLFLPVDNRKGTYEYCITRNYSDPTNVLGSNEQELLVSYYYFSFESPFGTKDKPLTPKEANAALAKWLEKPEPASNDQRKLDEQDCYILVKFIPNQTDSAKKTGQAVTKPDKLNTKFRIPSLLNSNYQTIGQ